MGKKFEIEEQGFITKWLVSELRVQPFSVKRSIDDQLMFEKHMRECLADKNVLALHEAEALWDSPMRYLQNHKSWFVDFSEFYHLTKKIELNAKTFLVAKEDMLLRADLWTYGAVQIYVNGQCVCVNNEPVYKPIAKREFVLDLKRGENKILVRMQNLGVRDTRTIFGIQLRDGKDRVWVQIPWVDGLDRMIEAEEYLDTVSYHKGILMFGKPYAGDIRICETGHTVPAGFSGELPVKGIRRITLEISVGGEEIHRVIEAGDQIKPCYLKESPMEAGGRKSFFESISRIDPAKNQEARRFTIYPLLAKYAAGMGEEEDRQILLDQLDLLDTRIDCADFIANGFLRFMNFYGLDEKVAKRAKEVLLNFRYWMDEDGEDGMCFWSENHSLLFYGSLLLAAKQYPGDVFVRSGRTGRQQYEIAEKKVHGWLDDVLEHGFEEFLSGGYLVVTVAALLNLVDFAEEGISKKAARVVDEILITLSKHTFKGSAIAPEGRIYRDVIYPFEQGVQGLIHYINPAYPVCDNIWLASFAKTKYRIPEHLAGLMERECVETHETGNALITLNKKRDYVLTSAASPREDDYIPWYNNSFDEDADRSGVRYTKSINERFHGTTFFQPGVYGYQQHLWYAALNSECVVFTNHPGENVDRSSMRPAYWYGNGVFPAVKQSGNCLGVIYRIPKEHPIHFTHLYFPEDKFDMVCKDGNWMFARKGDGYLAIWSSRELAAYDDLLINCEYRSYGSVSAYVCICGAEEEYGGFDGFVNECKNQRVEFDEESLGLAVGNRLELKFEVCYNKTQYI